MTIRGKTYEVIGVPTGISGVGVGVVCRKQRGRMIPRRFFKRKNDINRRWD